jgi:hypothetical protein
MKRLIIYVLLSFLCYNGFAQKTNEKKSDTDRGEVGMSVSAFSYGILSQGVNTVTGTYSLLKDFYFNKETYREISDITWEDVKNADYKEFGKSLYQPFAEGLGNTMYNAIHGDAENRGRAAFDIGMIVYGAKGTAKSLVGPKQSFHYTNKTAAESIKKGGLNTGKDGHAYTTPDGNLSSSQAKQQLALKHKDAPTHRVEITPDKKPIETRKVQPIIDNNGQAMRGGGTEQLHNKPIPPENITEISKIDAKPIIVAKEAIEKLPYTTVPYILSGQSQNETTEGGHKLDSKIRTVILLDNTIKIGFYKQIDKLGVTYVLLNNIDLYRVNAEFLAQITNGNTNAGNFENKDVKPKTRNEVVPNNQREQRGLK